MASYMDGGMKGEIVRPSLWARAGNKKNGPPHAGPVELDNGGSRKV